MNRPLFYCCLTIALGGFGAGLVIPFVPRVLEGAGAGPVEIGLAAALFYLAFAAASLLVGRLIDRGARPGRLAAAGLALYGLVALLLPNAPSLAALIALRAVEGFGLAFPLVTVDVTAARLALAGRQGRTLGLYYLCFTLGLALGPFAGSFLLARGLAWTFYAGTLVCAVNAAGALLLLPATRPVRPVRPESLPLPAACLAAGIAYGLFESGSHGLLPSFLELSGIEGALQARVFGCLVLGSLAGQLPMGWTFDRLGGRRALPLAGLGLAAAGGALLAASGPHQIAPAVFALGFFGAGLFTMGMSYIVSLVSDEQLGAAAGHYNGVFGAGSVVGPIGFGLALDYAGPAGMSLAFVAVGAAAMVVTFLAARRDGR